jgi:hypothetical protein
LGAKQMVHRKKILTNTWKIASKIKWFLEESTTRSQKKDEQ